RNDSRLRSPCSFETTAERVIPSAAEESPERGHQARIDFFASVETTSCACHLDWREPATGMERSFLAVPPSMRFLHSLRSVEMTEGSTRTARSSGPSLIHGHNQQRNASDHR